MIAIAIAGLVLTGLPAPAGAGPGSPDPSFGFGGVTFGPTAVYQPVSGEIVQADGRIVVAYNGVGPGGGGGGFAVRFGPDGHMESSFTVPTAAEILAAPAQDTSGRMIFAVLRSGDPTVDIMRVLSDGSGDSSFGNNGVASTSLNQVTAVAADPSGRVMAAGTASGQPRLIRLDGTGQTDPSFGSGGQVPLDNQPGPIGVDSSGRTVVAETSPGGPLLARYLADGTKDAGFGNSGSASVGPAGSVTALRVEADSSVDAAVYDVTHGASTVLHLTPTGGVDTRTALGVCGVAPDVTGIVRVPSGDLVMSAGAFSGLLLIAVRPDGTVDPAFGNGGVSLTDVADGTNDATGSFLASGSALTPDGAVVTVGMDAHQFTVRPGGIYGPVTLIRSLVSPTSAGPLVRPIPSCGYWLAGADGTVSAFGDTGSVGSHGPIPLSSPVVGIASTPDGRGYWLVARDGGIFTFGDARFLGSTGAMRLNAPIVGMAPTPDGGGYWLVARDGGIFSFGDARFVGSTGAMRLNAPIVGMAATPDGGGYWLVARDGGIFSFGDATFLGSTGAMRLNAPIVGMGAMTSGGGYWLAASDGGVFSFGGALFSGSTGNIALNSPITAVAPIGDRGYEFVAGDGGVFTFGGATYWGSAAGGAPGSHAPVIGIAAR